MKRIAFENPGKDHVIDMGVEFGIRRWVFEGKRRNYVENCVIKLL